jgi:diaminohydroxyphosphoribosylaminopyrimidine deaminase/5-amino-6-(5-phosphoribosylamino)uracil reductase
MAQLRAAGADLLVLTNDRGRVDLPALLTKLATDGVNELHVEAGATLNAALLQTGLVDELLVYLAPKLLGPGRDIAALPALKQLSQAIELRFEDVYRVGDDVCLRARQMDADAFLT